MSRSALYVSYFGIRQPLVQTQVIPYLKELVSDGWSIHLMTFEPEWPSGFPEPEQAAWRQELQESGITWHPNRYTDSRGIPAKIRDIISGLRSARKIIAENQIKIVHGRAHVGTTIACLASLFRNVKILFDIRGFNPEEYLDSGHWSRTGLKFNSLKTVEKWLIRRSSGFVILTHAGRKAMFPTAVHQENDPVGMYRLPDGRPVQVIPCCVDPSRFLDQSTDDFNSENELKSKIKLGHCSRLVIHVGALSGLYPEDRIVAVFAEIYRQNPNTGFIILSQTDTGRLRELYLQSGLPESNLWTGQVKVAEVAQYLSISDWGLSLKCESYSQLSCSPTKIPEYLLAGLPVLASQGIGDTDHLIKENRVGIVFNAWDTDGIQAAVAEMEPLQSDPELKSRSKQAACDGFRLEIVGGPRYRAIYNAIDKM